MVSDQDRRALYTSLSQTLGEHLATVMMELLPPVGWGDVARQSDFVAIRGEMAELRGEMSELRGEIAELRAELKGEMSELRADLKGDIVELRGEMRALLPKLIAANIASMVGVSGLVLAAGALL
jgi:hypothetical protein